VFWWGTTWICVRWVYCIKVRGRISVSASKAVSSAYTFRARSKERLRLVINFLSSLELWNQREV